VAQLALGGQPPKKRLHSSPDGLFGLRTGFDESLLAGVNDVN
jgi:hypothetical protein